jgi:serine/threonine protein kinase
MSVRAVKTLGKYRLTEKLGRGVMAEVYRAYDPELNRYVAVKVLHSFLALEEDFLGRFEREATAMKRLRHPNIVQILDFDHEGDLYYIVMEFIDGPTLQAQLRERRRIGQPFDPKETAHILTAIGNAVDYVHRQGVVHRDLKPANIMFTSEGQPVLTDFGIAKIVGAKRYTVTGAISGTPTYMSPEQGQGERGDERSDIYSLGVILYEMVTGRVPFDADTPFATIMKHINDPLPLPRQVYPQLSVSVERVILKVLSKNPDDRYQTAGEMAGALQMAIEEDRG